MCVYLCQWGIAPAHMFPILKRKLCCAVIAGNGFPRWRKKYKISSMRGLIRQHKVTQLRCVSLRNFAILVVFCVNGRGSLVNQELFWQKRITHMFSSRYCIRPTDVYNERLWNWTSTTCSLASCLRTWVGSRHWYRQEGSSTILLENL
jgi:hypothetical protein